MLNIKTVLNKKAAVCAAALLLIMPGCSLEEDTFSLYTPETFYTTDAAVLSSLSGVYRNFAQITGMGAEYRVLELSADQVVVHAKEQGWWGGDDFWTLQEHTWTPDNGFIASTWNTLFATVGQANALLDVLDASTLESAVGAKAELRALRAYAYFYLMDLFGNVPLFLEPRVDPLNLPEQNTRAEIFDFVVKELQDAAQDLPSQNGAGNKYYGRLTQEAVYAILATVYLNSEVYTGTARWDETMVYADKVIESGAYALLPNYFDNFTANNEGNKEFIFGGVYTPNIPGGLGQPMVQKVMPGISGGLFGLPYTPQNGFGTRTSILEMYEAGDIRKNMFFPAGELKDPRTGETVMVERIISNNNSVMYRPGISTEGPVPYVIIPATGIRNQPMNAGEKWMKWGLDPSTNGGNAGNDIAFIRYADVLLMKAEALARKGNFTEALSLVNEIRDRSEADPFTELSLEDILDERGRELAFEMSRRRDLIRFGKFNQAWEFKAASEPFRTLYPIPTVARAANPKLQQNTGY